MEYRITLNVINFMLLKQSRSFPIQVNIIKNISIYQ